MAKITQKPDFQTLTGLLGQGQVITDPVELITYERDATLRGGHPDVVVHPASTEEVTRVIDWAGKASIPIVARGAGTGLSGGAVPEQGGVIFGFSKMNQVLELDVAGRSARLQPGVITLSLDEQVKNEGLFYPPDPASGRATTLGGNIGENSGGPHCYKYGVTTNFITGLEAALADGSTVVFGGQAFDYPEYDLAGLLTGSEGTLGIVTEAYVRLLRNPPSVKTMMAAFDTVEEAGNAVSAVIAAGLVPATLEMMDQKMMKVIEEFASAGLPVEAGAALIIEVDGYPESLPSQMEEIESILSQHQAHHMRVAGSEKERGQIWFGRKSAFGAMARLAPSYYVLDGTVPRSRLGQTLTTIGQICRSLDLLVANVFHAGDGNLHPLILIENPSDQQLMDRVHQAGRQIMELCVAEGGSISGEHGIGIEKREYMPLMYSSEELRIMMDVKEVFDPKHLLNPGKIFPGLNYPDQDEEAISPATSDPPSAPRSTEEAAEALGGWRKAKRDVLIQGGNSKSGLIPKKGTHTIKTKNLKGIRSYALKDLYVTVGSGISLVDLQTELAKDHMWVPLVSPWEESTVGGIVSSNFNAPLRMRYGGIRDLVLEMTVVLPDGRIIQAGRPVVKNVAGYDLPKLFVGTYGSLGLITELTFKIVPLPRARASLVAPIENLEQGIELGKQLLQVCLTSSALLLCRRCTQVTSSLPEGTVTAPYALYYTAEGIPEDVQAEMSEVRTVLDSNGAGGLLEFEGHSGSKMWANWIRDRTETSLIRVGVAPRDLPASLLELAGLLDTTSYVADLASGLLYVQGGGDLSGLQGTAQKYNGYALPLAGPESLTVDLDNWKYLPQSLDLMRRLKTRWDEGHLLNAGVPVTG